MRRLVLVWPVVLASMLCAAPASAATLALDAPDGSVVVTHSAPGSVNAAHVVARYDGAGGLDRTFGIEGYRRTIGEGLIRQPDGRLITYGSFAWDGCCNDDGPLGVWRHLPDGALDESFGTGGKLAIDMVAAALAPAGSIVVASHEGGCIHVRRVGPNGTLDPEFAAEPICEGAGARHVDVLTDGIYVAGPGLVARLRLDDGALDDSFGDGGIVRDVGFERMLVTSAGLVMLGIAYDGTEWKWVVDRYRADGTRDPDFGEGGRRELPQLQGAGGVALGEAVDGSLLVATTVAGAGSQEVAVTRLTSGGDIDAAYGGERIEIEPYDWLKDLVVLPDGGVVLALQLAGPSLGLARLTASGQLDTDYGEGGRVSTTFDVLGPPTTIDTADTAGTSATFTFSATEPDVTFRCSVAEPMPEPGEMSPCQPGIHYQGLPEGQRVFHVRALDRRGNSGPLTQWNWVANARPPQTTLSAAPPAQDRETVARFELVADEPARFECSLDGVPRGCGPAVTVSVGPGEHSFTAQAIDFLGAPDPSPVVHSWNVDLDAPDTRIDAGPPPTTTAPSAELSFSSSDPTAGFECRRDGGAWAPCGSPAHLDGLAPGVHDFQVRAVDAAGNIDAAGAERLWRVEEPPAPGPGGPFLGISSTDRTLHRAGGRRTVLQRVRIHNGLGRRGTIRLCAIYPEGWRAPVRARGRRMCLRRAIAAGADTTFSLRGRPPRRPRAGTLRYSVAFPALATQSGTARWIARR